jgi:hypothetical protein
VIVAGRFGWAAVKPEPMDWVEFSAACQHLAEERVGRFARAEQNDEDAAFAAAKQALGG